MSEDRWLRLEQKIDKITDKLHETNVTLARNTESLIIHEKRTDLAEQKLDLLATEFSQHTKQDEIILSNIEQKLSPITDHVNLVNVVFKYVIPAISSVLIFLYKINFFK